MVSFVQTLAQRDRGASKHSFAPRFVIMWMLIQVYVGMAFSFGGGGVSCNLLVDLGQEPVVAFVSLSLLQFLSLGIQELLTRDRGRASTRPRRP